MDLCAVLIDADPGRSLGGSVSRDLVAMTKYLQSAGCCRGVVFSTHPLPLPAGFVRLEALDEDELLLQCRRLAPGYTKLFFFVSGHGYQEADRDGDEVDGQDEFVVVTGAASRLTDDQIHSVLTKLSPTNEVFAVCDTCHSGTMLDLAWSWDGQRWYPADKSSTVGTMLRLPVFSLSACTDAQLAACDIGPTSGFGGALTVHFIDNDLLPALLSADVRGLTNCLRPILSPLHQMPVCHSSRPGTWQPAPRHLSINNTYDDNRKKKQTDSEKQS